MNKVISTIICFMVLSSPIQALEVSGVFKQGGYVLGQTEPEAKVILGKYSTTAGSDGRFAIGIPRLQGVEAILTSQAVQTEKKTLIIEQQDYVTQKITGIAKRKVNPNPDDLKHIKKDKQQILSARSVKSELASIFGDFIAPVENIKRTGVYGSRRFFNGEERSWHKGVDWAAPTGTAVVAPANAIVRLALDDSFFNGNLIILDHGYNMMTIYAHLNSMDVNVGDKVYQGQKIGEVGQTGRATGPHLHWGFYWRNIALDPVLLLDK